MVGVGSWQLAVGSWQLAVGSWTLAVGSWPFNFPNFQICISLLEAEQKFDHMVLFRFFCA